MKLCYRGLSYEYEPSQVEKYTVSQHQQSHKLKYRGIAYDTNPEVEVDKVSLSFVAHKLIYRGIAYFVSKTQPEISPVDATVKIHGLV
ncbi:DUF4278 domain-containing protein [Nostoc parmelioides]|uniref:DUF4278 domain-containing protein n=1 Tax=Nostoc parmelioides FACHB-3921 TaxID=2692909 RepID=A0ABR8BP39_9NOSO|nr:DUF4278 domain-containing protein [Nostoc parmelioides]MBD2255022.1 DUF4278 domain-containing protein [Nostoc parmelioides FACHB-3921]